MSRCILVFLALLATLATRGAHAEPAATKASPPATCDRETTAIGRSACQLVASIAGQADSALVVAAPAVGDDRVALPAAISERLAQLVATKLGAAAQPQREPLT